MSEMTNAAPRQMKQPRKDWMRQSLRDYADALEAKQARILELEAEVGEGGPFKRYIVAALLLGMLLGAWGFR